MTRIDAAGRARFCDKCERPVYDSASMTGAELADLIARHEGRQLPCLQLHRRPDGTIVTRNCFARFARAGRFVWLKIGLAGAAFWSALGFHHLGRLPQRDATSRSSSEEISLSHSDYITGGLAVIVLKPPAEEATRLEARTPPSNRWSGLPAADRAPPLRTLEVDDESWNSDPRKDRE